MLWLGMSYYSDTYPVQSFMKPVHQEGQEIMAVLLTGPREIRVVFPHHIL